MFSKSLCVFVVLSQFALHSYSMEHESIEAQKLAEEEFSRWYVENGGNCEGFLKTHLHIRQMERARRIELEKRKEEQLQAFEVQCAPLLEELNCLNAKMQDLISAANMEKRAFQAKLDAQREKENYPDRPACPSKFSDIDSCVERLIKWNECEGGSDELVALAQHFETLIRTTPDRAQINALTMDMHAIEWKICVLHRDHSHECECKYRCCDLPLIRERKEDRDGTVLEENVYYFSPTFNRNIGET